ncbi:MAG: glycosyltransferase family 1 protein [Elusimicrobiota bacterium]|nr:glycosyltransferase family 1 protein [Elusimicrobiota bacterium]
MRVAILNLTGSGISGGYKRYLQNVLPLFAEDPRITAVLCASPRAFNIEEWVTSHPKIRFVECRPFRFLRHRPDAELEKELGAFAPDVIFVPVARHLRFRDVPTVTMIQNMAPLVSGAWSGLREFAALAAQWLETRIAVHKAVKVIAMSDFVRQFLLKEWGVPKKKIRLIYFGNSKPAEAPRRPPVIPAAGWDDFLFTAGSVEQYRGLEDVILCAAHARTVAGRPLKIVIGGSARKAMMTYFARLKALAEKMGVAEDLCWAGQLSAEEMTWCYNNCSIFLMTSRVESFAVVVLEALAHGCQCVSSDTPPLPEAFGGTAVHYPPGDHVELAHKIFTVLDRAPAEKQAIREKVMARNADFSWPATAERTIETLLEAANRAAVRKP